MKILFAVVTLFSFHTFAAVDCTSIDPSGYTLSVSDAPLIMSVRHKDKLVYQKAVDVSSDVDSSTYNSDEFNNSKDAPTSLYLRVYHDGTEAQFNEVSYRPDVPPLQMQCTTH